MRIQRRAAEGWALNKLAPLTGKRPSRALQKNALQFFSNENPLDRRTQEGRKPVSVPPPRRQRFYVVGGKNP